MISIDNILAKHKLICTQAQDLARERGLQYADENDTLVSFEIAAKLVNKRPVDICLDLIGVKVARMARDIKNGIVPGDSIPDAVNYIIDLKVLAEEMQLG